MSTVSFSLTINYYYFVDHTYPSPQNHKPRSLDSCRSPPINSNTTSHRHTNMSTAMATEMARAPTPSVTGIQVEGHTFPPKVGPPCSHHRLFLGGAGVRGLTIQGMFVKFTAIAVYLEDNAVPFLAVKWGCKSAEELAQSVDFFKDVVSGPFEKFTQVRTIKPLTGQQYSEKVAENCVAYWKAIGTYTDEEEKAVNKFLEVFKDQNFPPGSSILFTQSPHGSLSISFPKGDSIPETVDAVINNRQLSEAILESIIGKNGVSPETKETLAGRMSDLMKEKHSNSNNNNNNAAAAGNEKMKPEKFNSEVKPVGS